MKRKENSGIFEAILMNFEEALFPFTFFLNCSSLVFDQSAFDVTAVDVTAISTPLERVPLYTVMSEKEPIILLKSSQAASSSDRLSFGTPETTTVRLSIELKTRGILLFSKFFSFEQRKQTCYKCLLQLSTQTCGPRLHSNNLTASEYQNANSYNKKEQ